MRDGGIRMDVEGLRTETTGQRSSSSLPLE